jgi:RimJ/RimL family protein N-acetyltransferase
MILREATADDIPFVMCTERLPGYEFMIGRWEADKHAAEMAQEGSRYLIAEEQGAPVAFAILQKLDDRHGNVYLNRFAVSEQGVGVGTRTLALVQDWVFAQPQAYRLHLHFSEENARGRRLYARAGFQEGGVERQVYARPSGGRVDTLRVSILRPEWEKLRGM